MTPAHVRPDPLHDPVRVAEAGLLLLRTGRPGMALQVLEPLPALLRAATAEARDRGEAQGLATAACTAAAREITARRVAPSPPAASAAKPPPGPTRGRVAQELREHVGRLGADRVAELLRVGLDDLAPLLEGRVSVATSAMAKLRRAA